MSGRSAAYQSSARRRHRRRAAAFGVGYTCFRAGCYEDVDDEFVGVDTAEPYGSMGGQPLPDLAELIAVFYDVVDGVLYIVFDGEEAALEDYDIYLDGLQITPTWDISAGTSEAACGDVPLANDRPYKLEFR